MSGRGRRADAPIRILARDAHLIVVEKPPGLPTTSPDGGDCLASRVQALDPGAERCHPSSRLDTDVTGVVVFARTSRGIDALLAARRSGSYARRYVAFARAAEGPHGLVAGDERTWTWPIAIDPRNARLRTALAEGRRGERMQEATTRAMVLASSPSVVSLRLEPVTGRTHQLRAHAARAGLPLLGDAAYGGARRVVSADGHVVPCARVALHCMVVVVPTVDGEPTVFRSALPDDLVALCSLLGLPPIDLAAVVDDARASFV